MKKHDTAVYRLFSARHVIVMTALMLLLAAFFVLLFCYSLGLLEVPAFIKAFSSGGQNTEKIPTGDNMAILDALRKSPSAGRYVQYDVGALDAAMLLLEAEPSSKYYMRNTVTYYNAGQTCTRQNSIYRDGSSYRVEIYDEEDVLLSVTVCDGTTVCFIDYTESTKGTARSFPISDSFTPESACGMPNTALLQRVAANEESEWALDETALIRSEYGTVYYIGISRPDMLQTESVYISLEYAVPIYAQIDFDGEVSYQLTTLTLQNNFDDTDGKLFRTDVTS